jgi:bacterioferritin
LSVSQRLRQCEALGRFCGGEATGQILMNEQDHQINLAAALGEGVLNVSG